MNKAKRRWWITDRFESSPEWADLIRSYPFKPYYHSGFENSLVRDLFLDALSQKQDANFLVGIRNDRPDCLGVMDYSAFDSEVFNLKIGRLSQFISSCANPRPYIQEIGKFFQAHDFVFVDTTLNALEPHLLPHFQAEGFVFVGANVTMQMDKIPQVDLEATTTDTITIREVRPDDLNSLLILAQESFADMEHNQNRFLIDGYFSPHDVARLYRRWFANCASGERARKIFVAESEANPIGFIACNIASLKNSSIKIGEVPLNAVASDNWHRGIYKRLVSRALQWFARQNCDKAEITTQISTYAPQYVWQKYGGKPVKYEYNLHKWLIPPTHVKGS